MPELTWKLNDAPVCDGECDHLHCAAYRRADGMCLLCAEPLDDPELLLLENFAYRSNGSGASHVRCRIEHLGRPLEGKVATDGLEVQVSIPLNEAEAEKLSAMVAWTRRFAEAGEAALRAYEGRPVKRTRS